MTGDLLRDSIGAARSRYELRAGAGGGCAEACSGFRPSSPESRRPAAARITLRRVILERFRQGASARRGSSGSGARGVTNQASTPVVQSVTRWP